MPTRLTLALIAAVVVTISAFWWWMGRPIPMPPTPIAAGEKLPCVSYAPFRRGQSPFDPDITIPPTQIDDDFLHLKTTTRCVRLYAVDQGLDKVPEIARRHGLKVMLGAWIGRKSNENALQIDKAVELANAYPDVVEMLIVGNETLLRGEQSGESLGAILESVRSRVKVPITYADVWEFWLKNKNLAQHVDVVTVHILPYWEDEPVAAEQSGKHIEDIRKFVGTQFPDKRILIGETGYPSEGRMRWGARPTPANQARVMHDIYAVARKNGFEVNYIEAFDQPWKRMLEGTVGGYWGLLDADTRMPKFQWGEAVSNHPKWRTRAAEGVILALFVFMAASIAGRQRPVTRAAEIAVAITALTGGVALGVALHMWEIGSRSNFEALRSAIVIAVAIATPIVAAAALAAGTAPSSFRRVLSPGTGGERLASWLGLLAILTAVVAGQFALGLAFDARYREFPFSTVIGPIVAIGCATLLGRGERSGPSEHALSVILVGCAIAIVVQERLQNYEALAFAAALVSLAGILSAGPALRVRAAKG